MFLFSGANARCVWGQSAPTDTSSHKPLATFAGENLSFSGAGIFHAMCHYSSILFQQNSFTWCYHCLPFIFTPDIDYIACSPVIDTTNPFLYSKEIMLHQGRDSTDKPYRFLYIREERDIGWARDV